MVGDEVTVVVETHEEEEILLGFAEMDGLVKVENS